MDNPRIKIEYTLNKEFYKKTIEQPIAKLQLINLFELLLFGEIKIVDQQTNEVLLLKADLLNFVTQLSEVVFESLKNDRYRGEIFDIYQNYSFDSKVKGGYLYLKDRDYERKFKLKKLEKSLFKFKIEMLNDISKLYPEILKSKHWKEIKTILQKKE